MSRKFQPSLLALAILTLLHEAPMHPYRMQRLIKDRAKDKVINVSQRASLYQTINQLLRAGLITFWEKEQPVGFPERTVYKLTDQGRQTAIAWLQDMVSTPAQEFPKFPAALSLLPLLTPEDAYHQLEKRQAKLAEQIAEIDKELENAASGLPKLFLLESDYLKATLSAELNWVQSLINDLHSGRITWTSEWARPFGPPQPD